MRGGERQQRALHTSTDLVALLDRADTCWGTCERGSGTISSAESAGARKDSPVSSRSPSDKVMKEEQCSMSWGMRHSMRLVESFCLTSPLI